MQRRDAPLRLHSTSQTFTLASERGVTPRSREGWTSEQLFVEPPPTSCAAPLAGQREEIRVRARVVILFFSINFCSRSRTLLQMAQQQQQNQNHARLAELSPDECLDLELWDHIFDDDNDDAADRTSPLKVLARDLRAQLEVRVNTHTHTHTHGTRQRPFPCPNPTSTFSQRKSARHPLPPPSPI